MIAEYQQQLYSDRERYGYRYTFKNAGDRIPTHSHDKETEHYVRVIRGSVIITHGHLNYVVKAKDSVGPFSTTPHSIMAAEAGTIIENDYTSENKDWLLDLPESAYEPITRQVSY